MHYRYRISTTCRRWFSWPGWHWDGAMSWSPSFLNIYFVCCAPEVSLVLKALYEQAINLQICRNQWYDKRYSWKYLVLSNFSNRARGNICIYHDQSAKIRLFALSRVSNRQNNLQKCNKLNERHLSSKIFHLALYLTHNKFCFDRCCELLPYDWNLQRTWRQNSLK